MEPARVWEPLRDWMLLADEPAEVLLMRDVLVARMADLRDDQWQRADDQWRRIEVLRLEAAQAVLGK